MAILERIGNECADTDVHWTPRSFKRRTKIIHRTGVVHSRPGHHDGLPRRPGDEGHSQHRRGEIAHDRKHTRGPKGADKTPLLPPLTGFIYASRKNPSENRVPAPPLSPRRPPWDG